MTSLPALDGTLFALGARGALGDPAEAAFAGLTVIAGAGAWIAARAEFRDRKDAAGLALLAGLSTLAAVAAAWAGAEFGAALALRWFPPAAGLALLALAADAAGLARAGRFAAAFVVGGVVLEVVARTL